MTWLTGNSETLLPLRLPWILVMFLMAFCKMNGEPVGYFGGNRDHDRGIPCLPISLLCVSRIESTD